MLPTNLDQLERVLRELHDPRDLFGDDITGTLHVLQVLTHPDRHPDDVPRAKELFNRVTAIAQAAAEPPVVLTSPIGRSTYTLRHRLATGDTSDVYYATSEAKTDEKRIIKVSRIPGGDIYLRHEQAAVDACQATAGTTAAACYFPQLIDSFQVRDSMLKRVNVFRYVPHLFTLEQIKAKYPHGLDGVHLAWIFNRLLEGIHYTSQAGYVHGAILPCHCLIHAQDHGLQFVGWVHGTKIGRVDTICKRYRDFYPPEILNKQQVTTASAIFMAVKCMIWLAGGDPATDNMLHVLPSFRDFWRGCLLKSQAMRPSDALALHAEFKEVLKLVYGKPRFHQLVM